MIYTRNPLHLGTCMKREPHRYDAVLTADAKIKLESSTIPTVEFLREMPYVLERA